MSCRKTWVAGLFILAVASAPRARAQAPAAGAAPGGVSNAASAGLGGAGAGLGAPAAAGAAAPRTIWSMFGLSSSNIHACIAKLCNSQIGQMANSLAAGPVGAVSGGFIPPLCPVAPSPDQIAALEKKAPGGAEATAAKIKASEADAKARVAAVEYLGTVDCTRWKEATKALVIALRADPNECVRYAAARVLNSGCCCNKDTIEALRICVAGDDKDGNPPETSVRVKAAAFNALQNCLMKVPDVLPEEAAPRPIERERGQVPPLEPLPAQPLGRERSSMSAPDNSHLAVSHITQTPNSTRFEDQLQRKTYAQTVNEARATLFKVTRNPKPPNTLPAGKRSMLNALIKAREDIDSKARKDQAANAAQASSESDPGVVPSSFNPVAEPGRGDPSATPTAGSGPMSSTTNPTGTYSPDGAGASKRGLFGLLLNSRNRRSDQ
jgi:hypothetical protein